MGFDSIPVPDCCGESNEIVDLTQVIVAVDKEAIESRVVLAMAELIEYLNTTSEELHFSDECIAQLVEKYAGENEDFAVLLSDRMRNCQEMVDEVGKKLTLRLDMVAPSEGGPTLSEFTDLILEVQQILGVNLTFSKPRRAPTADDLKMQKNLEEVRAQWAVLRGF